MARLLHAADFIGKFDWHAQCTCIRSSDYGHDKLRKLDKLRLGMVNSNLLGLLILDLFAGSIGRNVAAKATIGLHSKRT